jgi:hypothetical protein
MTQTTEPMTASLAERYLAVWREPDLAARQAAIAELWTPEGIEFVEGARFQGYAELQARVAGTYEEFVAPGRYALTAAGDVTRNGDIITLTVQLTEPDGEIAWAARVFLLLGADGRIREDYQLTVKPMPA